MKKFSSPRTTLMLIFASFGATMGAWAGSMPKVTAAAEINAESLGLTLTIMALATVIAMSLGGVIGKYATNRTVLLASLPLMSAVTFLLLIARSPAHFMISAICLGALLGIVDLFMNAEASALEHRLKRQIFMAFHGAVSISIAIFALLSSFLSYMVAPWAIGLCIVLLQSIFWLYLLRSVPLPAPEIAPKTHPPISASSSMPIDNLQPLSLMGMAAGLTIACETMSVFWSANLLTEQAPQLATIAGLGVCFYGICTAIVRLAGDNLRRNFSDMSILLFSMMVAIGGFIALLFSPSFTMSVIAFAFVGFGLALLCPLLYSMAAATTPENRGGALAYLSLVAGPLRIIIPWLFGIVAASFSSSIAFGGCSILMGVASLLMLKLQNKQ